MKMKNWYPFIPLGMLLTVFIVVDAELELLTGFALGVLFAAFVLSRQLRYAQLARAIVESGISEAEIGEQLTWLTVQELSIENVKGVKHKIRTADELNDVLNQIERGQK